MLTGIAISLLGTAASAIGSTINNRNQQRLLDSQRGNLNREYLIDSLQSPMERSDTMALINQTDRRLKAQNEMMRNRNKILGATNDSVVAQQSESAKALSEAFSNINALNQQRKDALRKEKRENDIRLDKWQKDIFEARDKTYENLANNAAKLGSSVIESGMSDKELWSFGKKSE